MDLLLKVMYLKLDFHKSVNSSTISDADYTTDTSLFSQKITWQKKKNTERETERQIIKDYPIFKDNFGQTQNWTQKAWVMSELLCELRQVIYPFLIFIFKKIW